MKTCTKCKIEKNKSEFPKDIQKKDGIGSHCKFCRSISTRLWRENNRDAHRSYSKLWSRNNPERASANVKKWTENNQERIKLTRKIYIQKNYNFFTMRAREWALKNKDRVKGYSEKWRKLNPDKLAENHRNRRAKKRLADGKNTTADVRRIFDAQRGLCANCNSKLFKSGVKKYHVDHIMPLALGGSNWPSNLQCLCPTCNMKKNAKDPIAWAQENGRLL